MNAPAEKERVRLLGKARGPLRNFRLNFENAGERGRQMPERPDQRLFTLERYPAAQACEHYREQQQCGELRGKCLGGGDSDFRSGMRINRALRFPRNHTAHNIRNRHRE